MMKGERDPFDAVIGGRIRQRRMLLGMAQETLAEKLGLTFQQVQKYEKGANRVGSGRLVRIAIILDVPPASFLDGLAEEPATAPLRQQTKESVALAQAFDRITSAPVRSTLLRHVHALALSPEGAE